jgi:transcription factor IIIB subunit 2
MPGPLPARRPPRLASINHNPGSNVTNRSQRESPQRPAPPPRARKRSLCQCDAPDRHTDGGQVICRNCGTVLENDTIVAEVTFAETGSGAATVEGGFVGEGQRHANTMGGTVRGMNSMESQLKTVWRGEDEIRKLCGALHLKEQVEIVAKKLYRLAQHTNVNKPDEKSFSRGRRVRDVAAACIYLAERKQPETKILLMDLSEKIQVNVWKLGDTYKQLLRELMIRDPGDADGTRLPNSKTVVQQLEPLMLKFCQKLEFGRDSHRVAEDAIKLLKRMNRDWMIQGRQPAGLCGACIIMAARMNNFRRTVREVVYVVRVADSTINQRLYEFKRSKASLLTVDQFRRVGLNIKDNMLPPSIWRREEREEKQRKRVLGEEDATADADVVAGAQASERPARKKRKLTKRTAGARQAQEHRRDQDGFAIPDLPANQTAVDASADVADDDDLEFIAETAAREELGDGDAEEDVPLPIKKRGRPPKKLERIIIPDEDLEMEAYIEQEIVDGIEAVEDIFAQSTYRAAEIRADALRRDYMPESVVSADPDIGGDEFDDDPDVRNCLNTPAEVRIKERVWLTENEDWLRAQQAKMLAKELEAASGKEPKPKRTRKRTQADGLDGDKATTPQAAIQKLLAKRAKNFSSSIDYDKLTQLYGPADSAETTPRGSQAASPARKQTAQAEIVEEIIDDEEEEQVPYEQEEEEDLDNQYGNDDDEGFGDGNLDDDY